MTVAAILSQILTQVLPIVLPYGAQAVTQLVTMFSRVGGPTAADWQALEALTQTTARQQMLNTLAQHNIDPASPQGQAFLALVP